LPLASEPEVTSSKSVRAGHCSFEYCLFMRAISRSSFLRILISLLVIVVSSSFSHAAPSIAQSAPASGQSTQGTPNAASSNPESPDPGSNDQILVSYEGQAVTSVDLAGRPEAEAAQYASLLAQKPNQPFSIDAIDLTIAALKATGKFEDVRVQVDPQANGVRVLFILEPAVYFGIFEFPGAERFSYSRLVQAANYPVQTPLSQSEVNSDNQSLLNFVRQEGYFEADASSQIDLDSAHAIANVAFHVTLARRAKFGNIDIAGVSPEQAASLTHSLQTVIARLRSSAIRSGHTYRRTTLTHAAQLLQGKLQKQGWLGAQVKLAGAEYRADTHRADIHFDINLGEPTHVEINGAHVWSWTRKSLLPMYQGIGVDDESVQEGRQALESYFQAKGFFDVKVDSQLNKSAKGDTVVYQIAKDKKHKVADIKLTGNKQVPSSELTPQLAVEKKHFLSSGKFSDQLVRNSVDNLTAVYKSEGFSSVHVASSVSNRQEDVSVSFKVEEGPRDIVNSLKIEGADTFPQSQFAPQGLKLAAGQPYSQAHVESDRAGIIANYLKAGYLNSSFRETATAVAKNQPHRIDVVYHIHEGPRVYTADVLTLGRQHTQQRLINLDVAALKPRQPLTETDLLTAGSHLYDHPGVFDWAEVDPRRQITDQKTEDVLVKVHEAKRNEITYGIGFEVIDRGGSIPSGTVALPNLPPVGLPSSFRTSETTFYGPRGSFQYTRNNIDGKGDSISLTAFAGRLDQRGGAYYIVPHFLWSNWRATTSFSAESNEENPIFSSEVELASTQLQRNIDRAGHNALFLRYSYSKVDLTHVLIEALVPTEDQHVQLSTFAANLTRDTRDNPLDEHRGVLDSIELDINSTHLGSSVDFAKLNGQVAYYKQGFHKIVWANSVRIGLAQPYANSRVPLSERFFSGGGNTLRGFPLDGAGPQRAVSVCNPGQTSDCPQIQVPDGGNELLIINSEARIPLPFKKGLGIVAFYDGGNVFPSVGFHDFTSLYSNNIGLGLRYETPVGPVRVDIGRNLNPITGINATQYFISIGQAF
jgi:outer membrane protein insertion porin family